MVVWVDGVDGQIALKLIHSRKPQGLGEEIVGYADSQLCLVYVV